MHRSFAIFTTFSFALAFLPTMLRAQGESDATIAVSAKAEGPLSRIIAEEIMVERFEQAEAMLRQHDDNDSKVALTVLLKSQQASHSMRMAGGPAISRAWSAYQNTIVDLRQKKESIANDEDADFYASFYVAMSAQLHLSLVEERIFSLDLKDDRDRLLKSNDYIFSLYFKSIQRCFRQQPDHAGTLVLGGITNEKGRRFPGIASIVKGLQAEPPELCVLLFLLKNIDLESLRTNAEIENALGTIFLYYKDKSTAILSEAIATHANNAGVCNEILAESAAIGYPSVRAKAAFLKSISAQKFCEHWLNQAKLRVD